MYNIIAIERQYASGGNEIGRKLAKALGYKLYDRNILAEAAKNLGISHIYIENLEETGPGSTIFNLSKTSIGNSLSPDGQLSLAEKLFLDEKKIIEDVYKRQMIICIAYCINAIIFPTCIVPASTAWAPL